MAWKPGESGNPGGRSKEATALHRRARKKCAAAIDLCAKYVADEKELAAIRLQAATIILDRGLGKAAPVPPLTAFTDEELVQELLTRKQVRDAQQQRDRASISASEPEQ